MRILQSPFQPVADQDYSIDRTLMREPRLWVNRQKPVGPVQIDWTNSLAKDCTFFCNYGNLYRNQKSAASTNYVIGEELVNRYTADGIGSPAYNTDYNLGPNRFVNWGSANKKFDQNIGFNLSQNGQFTVMSMCKRLGASGNPWYVTDVSQTNWYGIYCSATGSSFGIVDNNNFDVTFNWTDNVYKGYDRTELFIVTSSGSNDARGVGGHGEFLEDTSFTYPTLSGSELGLGAREYSGAYEHECNAAYSTLVFWKRAFSNDELWAMFNDPYQFLIPA